MKCSVECCSRNSFARGYCRRHYAQMWRKGCIYEKIQNTLKIQSDVAAIERSLAEEQAIYERVVGLEGRMYHRRKITELQEQLRELQTKERN